jgi:predicted lipoprotein with Yx(FWY)xxD motif
MRRVAAGRRGTAVFAAFALLATTLVCLAVSPPAMSAPASAVQAHRSAYGTVLFDGRGFALYAFTADRGNTSRCSGACAAAWPPYIVKARPLALAGASQRLVGRIRRADGRYQATYAGHPLYYYVGDRKPSQILCQNVVEFGGRWLVVAPSGRLVR